MAQRNRANGWQHAKLSGHKNEDLVKLKLDSDPVYAQNLLKRIGLDGEKIIETSVGGLHETSVESVNGGRKTKSKTDLKLFLDSGRTVNISIKKSMGGQVYFVRAGLFIDTFERQFQKKVPESVKRAIQLFWAAAEDAVSIIEEYADRSSQKNYMLQIRHKSLNAETLLAYNERLYNDMLNWFSENSFELSMLSFSMGAAKDPNEWSEYVWYINLLGENDTDEIFSIQEVCKRAQMTATRETYYGDTNGGTTIQLPFGFVQWHQKQLQFHHSFSKLGVLLQ